MPNPSFEDTVHCPCPPLGSGLVQDATGWKNCGLTPDYYNVCANPCWPPNGVPNGIYSGFQYPLDGNAFVGIVTYQTASAQREYIAVNLVNPLIIGTKYFVSAHIVQGVYACAANKFGFKFLNDISSYNSFNSPPADNLAHVHWDSILVDSVNWTKVAGSFVADSAYSWLMLGNFFDNANTDTINCSPGPGDGAYYLIDGVCVSDDSLTCFTWTGLNFLGTKNAVINIYPNPVIDKLYFEYSHNGSSFSIQNSLGAFVIKGNLSSNCKEINVSMLPGGCYLLEIDKKYFRKFIIQRNY